MVSVIDLAINVDLAARAKLFIDGDGCWDNLKIAALFRRRHEVGSQEN